MNKNNVYITTPIYYASGEVHIGNSYSTVVCDVFARYHRLKGDDTYYLTGMDEHGLKIEEAAKAQGIKPQEFVDKIAFKTSELWKELKITNDDFIRTSQARHTKVVQQIYEKLIKNGDIYLGEYEGDYCVSCETFYTKTQLGPDDTCPTCGKKTKVVKEESYFLKLGKYADRLLEYIETHPTFIQPATRKNEVVAFIKSGLEDLCVSRTTIDWGIPILSNKKHVAYVWIDALANYITALGYDTPDDALFQKYWMNGQVYHVVGKDILRFHAIYWPIMLMALDIPINFELLTHGWILMKGTKMSKSKGNTIYPTDVSRNYGLDALRYYLIKEMPFGNDGLFTWELFFERFNSDLANDLGNLVSRTISMINKYFGGKVTKPDKNYFEEDKALEDLIDTTNKVYFDTFDNFQFKNGLTAVFDLISKANKYIDLTEPWRLAKDLEKQNDLNDVLYHLYEVLRITSIMLDPVMDDTSKIIFNELGLMDTDIDFKLLKYGHTHQSQVIKEPIVLFQRIKIGEELEKIKKAK